jgi:uncharacterized membrane protein
MSYWELLLAHRHWVTLRFFGKEIHLCARCSSIVVGFVTLRVLFAAMTSLTRYVVPFYLGFPVSLLLALPSILDWSSQKLSFRKSDNTFRLFTGFLEGVGVSFLGTTDGSLLLKTFTLATIGIGVVGTTYLARRMVS